MRKLLKVGIAFLAAGAAVGGGALFTTPAYAKENVSDNVVNNNVQKYHGEDIISGKTLRDESFKYSDGFFNTDSKYYNPHMATASCMLAQASDMNRADNYSHGADVLVDLYKKMGYSNIYVSQTYNEKPTVDSVACVIAYKNLKDGKKVVAITVRSAGYEAEWASNVTLGTEGEAKGFGSARDQVIGYLKEYIKKYRLKNDLDAGKVKFWVSGFSRGGATANLTAKTLIDKYQKYGNDMYAYCIEAPRGGVKEEINKSRNYDSIHNVINANDLVPCVAPKNMGFIRYGVDHSLIGSNADYSKVLDAKNNNDSVVSDNVTYSENSVEYKQQKDLYMKQAKITGTKYKPYEAKSYRLNLGDFSIEETGTTSTAALVNRLANTVASSTSREEYATKGYEKAAFNLLSFTNNTNVGFGDIFNALTEGKSLYDLLPIWQIIKAALPHGYVVSSGNIFKDAWNLLFNRDEMKLILKLTNEDINNLTNGFVDNLFAAKFDALKLFNKDELMKLYNNEKDLEEVLRVGVDLNKFFENYEGGVKQAKTDVGQLIKLVLKNVSDPDFIVTVFKNIGSIIDNHQMSLTETWLKTYDSWFEDTIFEVEV